MAFFEKKAVGLDLAENTAEVVYLKKSVGKFHIASSNRALLEDGLIKDGLPADEKKLSAAIEQLLAKAKPESIDERKLRVFVPERYSFTTILRVNKDEKGGLEDNLALEVKRSIPHPFTDLVYKYTIRREDKEEAEVLVAAAPRSYLASWSRFFTKHDIEVGGFDIEVMASFRALFSELPKLPVCLVDIGKKASAIAIFDSKGLSFSFSSSNAGDAITQSILQKLKVKEETAEEKKRKIGLKKKKTEAKVSSAIESVINGLCDEIAESLDYFKSRTELPVEKIILIGGSSQMPGIAEYMSQKLGVSVEIGSVSEGLFDKEVKKKAGQVYLGAVGAAMREFTGDKGSAPLLPSIEEGRRKLSMKKSAEADEESEAEEKTKTQKSWFARNKKMAILAGVLIAGLLLLAAAFAYRFYGERESPVVAPEYDVSETLTVHLPLIVAPSRYSADVVRGRIIIKSLNESTQFSQNMAILREEIDISEGEAVWPELLEVRDQQGAISSEEVAILEAGGEIELELPLLLDYLVYSQSDARRLAIEEFREDLPEDTNFLFDGVEYISVTSTEDEALYILRVNLSVSLAEPSGLFEVYHESIIPAEEPTEEEPTADDETVEEPAPEEPVGADEPTVRILPTGVGYLNVRSGPGTDFPIVAQVYPGDEYPLLNEDSDWYQIQIDASTTGWVISQYAETQ